MKDWRTSIIGIVVLAVGILHALQAKQIDAESMGMFSGGVGLILAADGNKPENK